jgi:UDP-2,4-diacetamido-2,4,6-trideoxy-beta-L-altropyranose hydrolase
MDVQGIAGMKIAFRTDASLAIGSGHVMRCLTLADALKAHGADCHFISRAHPGHLLEVIEQRGHKVHRLAAPLSHVEKAQAPAHAAWLGSTWQTDAADTAAMLADLQPDWLVVDHYALDQRWEEALALHYRKLLIIDDLADRAHHCDLLLDQNLGRQAAHYAPWVPAHCRVLTGPKYALLRPEFAALRSYSLQRRQAQPALLKLLITMGGVDQPNATEQVLQALKTGALPADCSITVVMGLRAPWLQNVKQLAAQMPWPTEVVVNINDIAQRMADSDLAIGAGGSTSWERCCMGLPTLMVVLADNQKEATAQLQKAGAASCLEFTSLLHQDLHNQLRGLIAQPALISKMSNCACSITNGLGTERIISLMKI